MASRGKLTEEQRDDIRGHLRGTTGHANGLDGESIGLGQTVGMSGLRIVIYLAAALKQRDLSAGAATVSAGSGLGTALILRRK